MIADIKIFSIKMLKVITIFIITVFGLAVIIAPLFYTYSLLALAYNKNSKLLPDGINYEKDKVLGKIIPTVYYIDGVDGNDANKGTSPKSAWKSLNKISTFSFSPGDTILFRKGQTFNGTLQPKASGTDQNRIYFGSYGKGHKPVISKMTQVPGSNIQSNWHIHSGNVWYMLLDGKEGRPRANSFYFLDRFWIDGQAYATACNETLVNSTDRVFATKTALYIYSEEHPSLNYIEYTGHEKGQGVVLKLVGTDYITFDGLVFQGGYNCVAGKGADFITIKNSVIKRFRQNGIACSDNRLSCPDSTTDHWVIESDTIDFDYYIYKCDNSEARYSYFNGSSGIFIYNNASYWEVKNSFFNDINLAAVCIFGGLKSEPKKADNNKIHHNKIVRTNSAISRSFAVYSWGAESGTDNEIYCNYVYNMTLPAQVAGIRTKVYYNIFDKTVTSTILNVSPDKTEEPNNRFWYASSKSSYAVNPNATGKATKHGIVYFYNNTIYDSDRQGIWINVSDSCVIKNNLVINCGDKNGKGQSVYVTSLYQKIFSNNCYYNSNYNNFSNVFSVVFPEFKGAKGINLSQWLSLDKIYNGESKIDRKLLIKDDICPVTELDKLITASGNHNTTFFMPAPGSPLIDAGTDVGLTQDFFGNPIAGKPDIGAIELQRF